VIYLAAISLRIKSFSIADRMDESSGVVKRRDLVA
jgi:hypothetical protein